MGARHKRRFFKKDVGNIFEVYDVWFIVSPVFIKIMDLEQNVITYVFWENGRWTQDDGEFEMCNASQERRYYVPVNRLRALILFNEIV
jgi:hypothetical protein